MSATECDPVALASRAKCIAQELLQCDRPSCRLLAELAKVSAKLDEVVTAIVSESGCAPCFGDLGVPGSEVMEVNYHERIGGFTALNNIDIGTRLFEEFDPTLLTEAELAAFPTYHAVNTGPRAQPELVAVLLTSHNPSYPVDPSYAFTVFRRDAGRMTGPIAPMEFEQADFVPEPVVDGVYTTRHNAIVFRDAVLQAIVEAHPPTGAVPLSAWWLSLPWWRNTQSG